ncbi:hypothetical protein QO010_000700 [Caulobacter ginsengisoli]|uniref:Uncharacterized protein n=1 Tax=Caulobacter ginsengisoli TaxID=400775 RepID=A0ABU0ILR2_9CAUL|nr:hypothetical protein [Caulobacter ginsengisoli]MDQ0462952.1 hypothetical protein [Caulobacter ginsengisoli]
MELPNWTEVALGVGDLVETAVVAVATIFLWRVTKTLADETRRMAEASAQPQVVATLEPNQWALNHADLVVANTGNATAFDIRVSFDPPLQNAEVRGSRDIPLQRISLLKPGQTQSSYLSAFEPIIGTLYTVTIRWKRDPGSDSSEAYSYTLDLGEISALTRLGAASPMIQIAEQMKKLREDIERLVDGRRTLEINTHSPVDRLHERRERDRWRRRTAREQAAASAEAQASIQPPEPPPIDPAPRPPRRRSRTRPE